jgi:hypothetical protein
MRRLVAVFVAVAVVTIGACEDAGATHRSVLVYGDSLSVEAAPTIRHEFASRSGWAVEVHAWPGISLCTQLSTFAKDIARTHPTVVVIETYGSTRGACMAGADGAPPILGSETYFRKTGDSIERAFRMAVHAGAHVVFIVAPPSATTRLAAVQDRLAAIARDKASHLEGVTISARARDALGATVWRARMPCLPHETAAMGCTNGSIAVRAPDKLHFCPVGYPDAESWFHPGCSVYSSGAFRFGRAIVSAALASAGP